MSKKKQLENDIWDAKKAKAYAIAAINSNKNHAFYADYLQFIERMNDRIEKLENEIKELK